MPETNQRFTALDIFRGMTICFMIIVNTPGNWATTYSPLLHAQWHGFTPTDLVFPSFLFAVGNALSFVQKKWLGLSQQKVLFKIFKRNFVLFLLGYLMYWFPFVKQLADGTYETLPIADTRIFGVLQRIALCYGIAALIIYYCKPKTSVILSILFLAAYPILLYVFGATNQHLGLQTNAGFYLDKWLMGEKHMYHGEGLAFDPEGLLSTLPAIVNVLAGYLAGKYIQEKGNSFEGLTKLLLAGAGLVFLAYCSNFYFPINKKLWTSSFVLITVGFDLIILAAIIYVVQFKQITRGTYFFQVMGRNPIVIYLLSELGVTLLYFFKTDANTSVYSWLYQHIFEHAGAYLGSFLFAISILLCCWLVGYWMDKRKIYIRV
ncbi:MAG: heparan-alpha-glucosaminide N-acetyltransferase domain-containing protein [Chitinophagaceae bacterium]